MGFIFIFFPIYCLKQCQTIIGGSFNFVKIGNNKSEHLAELLIK